MGFCVKLGWQDTWLLSCCPAISDRLIDQCLRFLLQAVPFYASTEVWPTSAPADPWTSQGQFIHQIDDIRYQHYPGYQTTGEVLSKALSRVMKKKSSFLRGSWLGSFFFFFNFLVLNRCHKEPNKLGFSQICNPPLWSTQLLIATGLLSVWGNRCGREKLQFCLRWSWKFENFRYFHEWFTLAQWEQKVMVLKIISMINTLKYKC